MSRTRLLVVVAVAAGVIVGGALVATMALTKSGSHKAAPPVGAPTVAAMLRGVGQQGTMLGSVRAPVTLVEFADPQCPYCADWARVALPVLVRDYVRPGKVRIVFSGMHFVGPDSETALRTALAAAAQNRFWNVLELLYENQGTENTGWVTDSLLRSIGDAVPGLSTQKMLDGQHSPAVEQLLAQADALAQQAGVTSTPTFAVGKTGSTLRIVQVVSLDAAGIEPAIDAALKE
ncbi:MAG TPA: thioredoxin domain-containing protein [Gaiellaceae bacterium]|nr:thioredoxin domain-containing protein [Gaiellaceae bacterium]